MLYEIYTKGEEEFENNIDDFDSDFYYDNEGGNVIGEINTERLKEWHKAQTIAYIQGMIEWVEGYDRLKCGKCDGAKFLEHALWCRFRSDIQTELKKDLARLNGVASVTN